MNTVSTVTLLTALLLAPRMTLHAANAPADKPNIILILADDLGYGDIGCNGAQDIRTPHLDRMAAEGTRLTDFSVTSALCTPRTTIGEARVTSPKTAPSAARSNGRSSPKVPPNNARSQ